MLDMHDRRDRLRRMTVSKLGQKACDELKAARSGQPGSRLCLHQVLRSASSPHMTLATSRSRELPTRSHASQQLQPELWGPRCWVH